MENLTLIAPFNLKDIVKDNKVHFDSYRAGFFYYNVNVGDNVYRFPVETNDIGQATLQSTDKAIYFMRWIKKSIENHQFVKVK